MPILTNQASRFLGGSRAPAAPVPVAGAELLVNGDFSAWTGDDPDGWSLMPAEDANKYITQAGNAARMVGDDNFSIYQSIATPGLWYSATVNVTARVSGSAYWRAPSWGTFFLDGAYDNIVTTGVVNQTGRAWAGTAACGINVGGTGGTDMTLDDASVKLLTLSTLISTQPYASADCDISVAVTRTAGTQAGLCARLDSAASPANFIIAYLDGAGNVKVDKCVAGTYTNVISGAVTYAAGQVLRLVCAGNNVSVYYNGTQVGSTTAVADAGITGNTRHGLFSTYAANTFTGYTAA